MIYYFTGAGNSRYVAQRIAKALGDTVAFMPDHIPATVPDNGEPVGFVMPAPPCRCTFLGADARHLRPYVRVWRPCQERSRP